MSKTTYRDYTILEDRDECGEITFLIFKNKEQIQACAQYKHDAMSIIDQIIDDTNEFYQYDDFGCMTASMAETNGDNR